MFIEITTESNVLRTENFLRPYKRGKKEFTPEVAHEVLAMTNHPRNIKDTLQLIADQPQSEQAQYKEIILSAFDHREQPTDAIILGKKLAVANGFEDELNAVLSDNYTNNGIIYTSATQHFIYINTQKIPDLFQYPYYCDIICTNDEVILTNTDLSNVKSLKFKEESSVDLSGCENLPADLDVSMCNEVILSYADLSTVKSLKFKEGSEISLYTCTNFPAEFDVSMCNKVVLYQTDLAPVKSLKFKEGSKVNLYKCKNLPADLDISMCDVVNLSYINFPADFSLKFKEGSEISLCACKNLPAELDFSMCNRVELLGTDLSSCQKIILKNREQLEENQIEIPENWQGELVYADEVQSNNNFSTNIKNFFASHNR